MEKSAYWAVGRLVDRRKRLIALSVARIGFSLTALHACLTGFIYREFLWGPHGSYPYAYVRNYDLHTHALSLYDLTANDLYFNAIFGVSIVVFAAWGLLGGRALTFTAWMCFGSMLFRNGSLGDGGTNIQFILMLFLCAADTNSYFSPFARGKRDKQRSRAEQPLRFRTLMANSVHNTAVLLVVFQICVVYACSSLWKFASTDWRSGTALYYISKNPDYSRLPLFPWFMGHPTLALVIGYATMTCQLCVIPAVLTRRRWFREIVLFMVACMHLGIMFGMGLYTFGAVMIASDALLLSDADYLGLARCMQSIRTLWRTREARRTAGLAPGYISVPGAASTSTAPDSATPASVAHFTAKS